MSKDDASQQAFSLPQVSAYCNDIATAVPVHSTPRDRSTPFDRAPRRQGNRVAARIFLLTAIVAACSNQRDTPPARQIIELLQTPAATDQPAPKIESCTVRMQLWRKLAEATATHADQTQARTDACAQACRQLDKPCKEQDDLLIHPVATKSDGKLHSITCTLSRRRIVTARGASCADAYASHCGDADAPPVCAAVVIDVNGVEIEPLRAQLERPAAPGTTGAISCEIVVAFTRAKAVAKREGDRDTLLDEARTAACAELGISKAACADEQQARTLSTKTTMSVINGKVSRSVEVTMAATEELTLTGRGDTKQSACRHAAALACLDSRCATPDGTAPNKSAPSLRQVDGVPVWFRRPLDRVFGTW